MQVDAQTRSGVNVHYETYHDKYESLWDSITEIANRFSSTDLPTKMAYLKLSYLNSVISVQTPLNRYEDAVRRLMDGQPLKEALTSVNYNKRKIASIRESLDRESTWVTLASALEHGRLDVAHRVAIQRLGYVGMVKAPFVFALLGFTEKMCLDINVARAVGLSETPTNYTIDQYQKLCDEIYHSFPQLNESLEPFHLQWVIFDWYRWEGSDSPSAQYARGEVNPVTTHDAWTEAALQNEARIESVLRSVS